MKPEFAKYLLNKTKEDYNLIAKEFSNTRQRPWPEIKFLFDKYLSPEDKVLDIGCGNGRFFPFFKGGYVGIDNSEKLIGLAREKFPDADFREANALNLPFDDESFDRVYSIAVLHHIPSKQLRIKFLKQAKRVLKADGKLILVVWKFRDRKELANLVKFTILKLLNLIKLDYRDVLEPFFGKALRYYHCFTKKELKRLAEAAGFVIQEIGVVRNKRGNRQNFYLIARKPEPS